MADSDSSTREGKEDIRKERKTGTDTEPNRQPDKQADKQTKIDRVANIQTDGKTDGQKIEKNELTGKQRNERKQNKIK